MTDRKPVTTVAELESLDEAEILEGYKDGLAGDDEPGGNRSKAYWHGWRNGRSDRTGKVDSDGLALAKAVIASRSATITYPPELLPKADEDGADVIVCCGDVICSEGRACPKRRAVGMI